jgi:hypothetical protein
MSTFEPKAKLVAPAQEDGAAIRSVGQFHFNFAEGQAAWKRRLVFSVCGLLAWAVTAIAIWNLVAELILCFS